MTQDRRQDDIRIEEIVVAVRDISQKLNEVHQRQQEVTLPRLQDVHNTLYLKGGLCEVSHNHTEQIKSLTERFDKLPMILTWIIGGFTAGASAILWISEHWKALTNAPK